MPLTEQEIQHWQRHAKSFTLMNMLLIQLETENKLTGELAKWELPTHLREKFMNEFKSCLDNPKSHKTEFFGECLKLCQFMIENDLYKNWLLNYLENEFKNFK